MKDEVEVGDKQAFMEMLVQRIVAILNNEPIDVYVNPTYLPACIAAEYDQLWTEERMDRVIGAAAKNGVAIEINAKLRLPRPELIKRAKRAGVKFTFGTNNGGPKLGRLEYCLDMIKECGLRPRDMFVPGKSED
jgi:histidinol phosphatase-like PHP family hydrolase